MRTAGRRTGTRDEAFDSFVAVRGPSLLRTAYLATGDEQAARRLLGDALVRTYGDRRERDGREGTEEHVRHLMLSALARGPSPVDPPPPTSRRLPDRIWAALGTLDPRTRAVLVLAVREGLDDAEIGRVVDSPVRTVRTVSASAVARIRSALESQALPPPVDDGEPGSAEPADMPASDSALLEGLRGVLDARAADLAPSPGLADEARAKAVDRARVRRRRLLAGAAVAVVLATAAGIAGSVTASRNADRAPPPRSPAGIRPSPASSVVPVPDTVLEMASDTGALLAYGSAVVDGTDVPDVVPVQVDPDLGSAAAPVITGLARAAGGYVVSTRDAVPNGGLTQTISFVRPDGARTELGKVTDATSSFVVSPDGGEVLHVIVGPVVGENAVPAGSSELVVQTTGSDVVNRVTVAGLARPVSVDTDRVFFVSTVDDVGQSYVWQRRTGVVAATGVPSHDDLIQVADGDAVLRSDGCLVVDRVDDPQHPVQLFRHCRSAFVAARLDPTHTSVAVVRADRARAVVVIRDARTGRLGRVADIGPGYPFAMEWTAEGTTLLVAVTGTDGLVTYDAVSPTGAAPGVDVGAYQVPQGPVLLGTELPALTRG